MMPRNRGRSPLAWVLLGRSTRRNQLIVSWRMMSRNRGRSPPAWVLLGRSTRRNRLIVSWRMMPRNRGRSPLAWVLRPYRGRYFGSAGANPALRAKLCTGFQLLNILAEGV